MKLILDENGKLIECIDDSEKIDEIYDVQNDPYWDAPIPVEERKHRRDKRKVSNKEVALKVGCVAVCVILLLIIFYKIVIELI